jgi:hypothetical protein
LAAVIGFGACKDKEKDKSKACDITSFKDGSNNSWNISGDNITFIYCKTTTVGNINPTIVVSDKATYTPQGAQDFSNEKVVEYKVTAEDGKTTKTYKAKATVGTTPCP